MQATLLTHLLSSSSVDPSLILTDPPPSTHPSFEPTPTFKSSFMDWKVAAKHRSEPCHLFLVAAEARRQRQTQIGALTWFQSLTLSSSPSLFDWVWKFNGFILIFVSLKILHLAIFYYKFVWKLRKWLRKCEKPIENLYFSKDRKSVV